MQLHTSPKHPRTERRFLLILLTTGLLLISCSCGAGEIAGPLPQTDTQNTSDSTDSSETGSPETTAAESAGTDDDPALTEAPALDITPAPTTAEQTGEGMLSPPSGSSSSVFGRASTADMTDENLASLLSSIQSELPTANGQWAVYLCDLFNDSEGSLTTESTSMQAASLIKLFIMGAVYENYETLCQQYGQDTIDANLSSMITVSDNDAANALVKYLGGGDSQTGMTAVNTFCQEHGYNDTSMGRLLLQSNEYGDNYTSVSDCGHFLRTVYLCGYEKTSQDFAYGEAMFSLLSAQTRRNKIPARLPEGVSVANKTGELSDVENDAGIIYDEGNDLIIVFMSQNLSEAGSAQNTIAALSREIYDYYN